MIQNIRLGSQETKLLFNLEMKEMSIFTFSDARDILEGTDSAIWNVIEGLKKRRDCKKLRMENICSSLHELVLKDIDLRIRG